MLSAVDILFVLWEVVEAALIVFALTVYLPSTEQENEQIKARQSRQR